MDSNKNTQANSSSFDDIDKKIQANQVLYDQLHQSLIDETISKVEEDNKKQKSNKAESSSINNFTFKLSNYYHSNELFRYALWGFAAVFFATTILTIIEYPLFSGSVKDDVGDGFMFGGSEPNWVDTFFHTFWWCLRVQIIQKLARCVFIVCFRFTPVTWNLQCDPFLVLTLHQSPNSMLLHLPEISSSCL